jgi:rhodanese-related sulfurtransferase
MLKKGYTNVRRYAGGISDWEEANYPMESEMV